MEKWCDNQSFFLYKLTSIIWTTFHIPKKIGKLHLNLKVQCSSDISEHCVRRLYALILPSHLRQSIPQLIHTCVIICMYGYMYRHIGLTQIMHILFWFRYIRPAFPWLQVTAFIPVLNYYPSCDGGLIFCDSQRPGCQPQICVLFCKFFAIISSSSNQWYLSTES